MAGTTHNAFAEALVPDQWTIYGYRLQPLCLGHYLLLQRVCPKVFRRGAVTLQALLMAARICSQPYKAHDPMAALRVGPLWACWVWMQQIYAWRRPQSLLRRLSLFRGYVAENLRVPEVWVSGTSEADTGTPFEAALVSGLIGIGLSYGDALSVPLRAAWWILTAHRESEGRCQVDDTVEHEAKSTQA